MSDGLTRLLSYGALSLVRLKNIVGWRREEKKDHLEITGNASVCKCFTEKRLFLTSKHLFGSHSASETHGSARVFIPFSSPGPCWGLIPATTGREARILVLHGTHTHTPLGVFKLGKCVCFWIMGGNWSQHTQKGLNLNPEPSYDGQVSSIKDFWNIWEVQK